MYSFDLLDSLPNNKNIQKSKILSRIVESYVIWSFTRHINEKDIVLTDLIWDVWVDGGWIIAATDLGIEEFSLWRHLIDVEWSIELSF